MKDIAQQNNKYTTEQQRIDELDALRGIAIFGILLMNITIHGLPFSYLDPTNYGAAEGANLWSWIITQVYVEGTQRGLFSILFGAGVILLTSRLDASGRTDTADIYMRRHLWLVVFGAVHCFLLLRVGEILFLYGVIGLFVFPFRKLNATPLLCIAITGLILNSLWTVLETRSTVKTFEKHREAETLIQRNEALSPPHVMAQKKWAELVDERKPSEKKVAGTVQAYKGGYFDILSFQAPVGARFHSWRVYRSFFDIFSMMILGMALFKLGVLSMKKTTKYYLSLMVVGYGIGLVINGLEVNWIIKNQFSIVAFAQAGTTYDIGRFAMTIGHIGAAFLLFNLNCFSYLKRILASVGRMALTNYVMHTVICGVIFYGYGFALYGSLQRYELYYVVLGICIFQMVLSPIWLKRYRQGPLEWLWRKLTYLNAPPKST